MHIHTHPHHSHTHTHPPIHMHTHIHPPPWHTQGQLMLNSFTDVESIPDKGSRKYRFLIACGHTGKPLEICADDQRINHGWILAIRKVSISNNIPRARGMWTFSTAVWFGRQELVGRVYVRFFYLHYIIRAIFSSLVHITFLLGLGN